MKERVLLTGASGSMGFEAFKLLWEKRERYEIVLLLRPSAKNKRLFRRYERESGIRPTRGAGIVSGGGLKIVWGDALNREDVTAACQGIDWCLHTMALISPEADRDPGMAWKVNYGGTRYIVEALEAQDPERTKLVYIGSVAEYGDRSAPLHVGRTGDPIIPSIYDQYALTKIGAELEVMQSRIRHRVSLRQTFIMIPGLFSLMDPIMFHQPINTFMENITARDSGRLLVNCLDIPDDSDFWGGYYNISGGPECRTTFLEFLGRIYGMLGLDPGKVMERRWFALKNFHMMFFEDAEILNRYLHHWEGGLTMEDFYREVLKKLPLFLKINARLCKYVPPYRWMVQSLTRSQLKRLAMKPGGTLRWIREGDSAMLNAFYGSEEELQSIPGWDEAVPSLDHNQPYTRLDHGYDESKETFEITDLRQAAEFRGGSLLSGAWNGDPDTKLTWRCCQDHTFNMTPHAVLRGGHWCHECISAPRDRPGLIQPNKFAAQVLAPLGRNIL